MIDLVPESEAARQTWQAVIDLARRRPQSTGRCREDHLHDQLRDLAFLLTLLDDPRSAASEMRGRERSWLRRRVELLDPGHPAWVGLEAAEDGRLALDTLLRGDYTT